MKDLLVLIFLALMGLSLQTLAATNVSSAGANSAMEQPKALSMTLLTGYTTNLYDRQDGTREQTWDFLTSASYKLNTNYSLNALLTGSNDLRGNDGSDFGQGQLSLRRSAEGVELIHLTPSLAVGLPVSKVARDDQSFLFSLKPGVEIAPSSSLLGSKRLSLALNLSASRSFHTYEQSKAGVSNAHHGSAQTLHLAYELSKLLQVEFSASHFNTWTYADTATESYTHSQSFSYQAAPSVALSMGHYYGAPSVSVYGPDGQTRNYDLISEKYSYVYTSLAYTY